MMDEDEKWSGAAFTASSLSLTPEETTDLLGIAPTRSHRIGDPISPRITNAARKDHYYSLHANRPSTAPMHEHLEVLLAQLEPRREALEQLRGQAQLCLFCGFSSSNGQGGFTLTPDLLQRISALGLELVLDLYPPNALREP